MTLFPETIVHIDRKSTACFAAEIDAKRVNIIRYSISRNDALESKIIVRFDGRFPDRCGAEIDVEI